MPNVNTPQDGDVLDLDPSVISADPKSNARFGLITAKVKALSEKIVSEGQLQAIEVSPLAKSENGFSYRLNFGNYRLAAIKLLNEQGAGLKIRAVVHATEPGKASIIRNLVENLSREDLTPMDEAVAASKLLDAGVDKMTIRGMFKRTGRKGPVSNSWLNITLSFLDLPAKVQNKIQSGEIDWSGAAVLAKVNKDNKAKLPDVIAELEADRQKAIDREEREEDKYLTSLKRAEELEQKAKDSEAKLVQAKEEKARKLQTAKEAVAKAEESNKALVATAQKAVQEATEKVKEDPTEGAKAVAEAAKVLEATKKAAEKESERAASALKKLEDKYAEEEKAVKEQVAEAKKSKKEASDTKKEIQPGGEKKKSAKEKPQSGKDVAKAASKAGAAVGRVALTRKDIIDVVLGMKLPGGSGKAETRITQLGALLEDCFSGGITDKVLYKRLLELFK